MAINMKHKIIKSIIIVAVVFMVTIMGIFFLKRGRHNLFYKIPRQAVSVLVIDVPALSAKLLFDEIGSDVKISSRLAKLAPDSLSGIDWNANGLNLFGKLALFTLEDTTSNQVYTSFILSISSTTRFNSFMKNISQKLHFSVNKQNGISVAFCKSLGILAAWNGDFVTGMKTSEKNDKNTAALIQVLSTPQQQSIGTDTCFSRKLAGSYDILFYSRAYKHCSVKQLENVNAGMKNITATIIFNKGELEINAEMQTEQGSLPDKIFMKPGGDMGYLADEDNAILNIGLHVNALAFKQFYRTFKTLDIKTNTPWLAAWDGNVNFVFNGGKNIENEYVTYSYDDNFNKIEKKEIKTDKVLNVQAIVGMNITLTDSLFKVKPLVTKGSDTLVTKGSNLVMTKTGNQFLIYSRYFSKPRKMQKKANVNIHIEANIPQMLQTLKDFGFDTEKPWLKNLDCKSITVNMTKKHNINLNCKLYFSDKNKNSIYRFLGLLENFSQTHADKGAEFR